MKPAAVAAMTGVAIGTVAIIGAMQVDAQQAEDVTLGTPVIRTKTAAKYRPVRWQFDLEANTIKVIVVGLDADNIKVAGTETAMVVGVQKGDGTRVTRVQGFAVEAGASPECAFTFAQATTRGNGVVGFKLKQLINACLANGGGA